MDTIAIPAEQRFRLSGISWEGYVAFIESLGERPVRVTYDRGEMEIMSPTFRHENNKKLLGLLIYELTAELEIDVVNGGSTTFRREELRGLEPDECYWIENEPVIRGREDIDLEKDPPPDLALEIEISRSALDRMSIYAALGVPEVWRWDGEKLTVHVRTARAGAYRKSDRSKAFPFLPMAEFAGFLERTKLSETQLLRSFRAWVRKQKKSWKREG